MTPAERYVDVRELAALMGVSDRTIKRMVAAGMPSETWGMARTRRFLPSQAIAWAQNRTTIRADNKPGRRTNAAMGSEPSEV
jgi:predicted DNA-binding transcriptional regulator YafY